jgi:hypothetical protein
MDPSRLLATINFEDQDAGSGPVHASPNLGPTTAALHNVVARNLHDIGAAVPDDRQFLRSWRRQLQDCLNQQNSRAIRFLLADISGSESEITRRCQDVLAKYSKSTWSFTSSTRDLSLPTGASEDPAALERELGIAPATLHEAMRRAVRLYVAAASGLTSAESRLEEKLKRLETVVGRVNDLMFMEPTQELTGLEGPVRVYLDSILDKITIDGEYRELMEQYRRFVQLKGIVGLGNFQRGPAPTCSICMTREVAQAVTPCGHTFCEECCRTQLTSCYICRVQIRDRLKLYFS